MTGQTTVATTGAQVVEQRQAIRCDCCGKEVLAWRYPDRIVINDTRHGVRHTAVILVPAPGVERPATG